MTARTTLLTPLGRRLLVLAGLVLFGLARLSFESQLTADFRAAKFWDFTLTRDVREQAGQMGFVAALSGFRGVVADFVWLEVYDAWRDTHWGRVKFLTDTATSLQPRNTLFWDVGSWHMAFNASANMMLNTEAQPRETLRLKAAREYILLGEQMLLRGISYNPEKAILYERLGFLYDQKLKDHCRAAAAYAAAAQRPDSMMYVHRMAVYQLAECPGHETEALAQALVLYHRSEMERLPSLLTLIDKLQKKLNVPESERIDIRKDMEEALPHPKKK